MAYEHLCMYCFEENGGKSVCPHCGRDARAAVPAIQLLPGTLLIMLPVYRMCKTRRFFVGFLCFFPLIIFQVAVWIGSICTMYVNKIPIATTIRILYNWVMSGAL